MFNLGGVGHQPHQKKAKKNPPEQSNGGSLRPLLWADPQRTQADRLQPDLCSRLVACARSSSATRSSFVGHDGSRDGRRSDHRVFCVEVSDQRHALRQDDVLHVQRVTGFNRRQIEFDEFRQVGRKAFDFDFIQNVRDYRATDLHSRIRFLIQEMDRYLGVQLLRCIDTLEVNVQNHLLERMVLHIAQQNLLRLASDFQVENRRMEYFFLQRVPKCIVIELNSLSFSICAIYDTRGLARVTQAAARTRTLQIALKSDYFHDSTP